MSSSERHLSVEEQAVILALLAQDFPGADELRAQVPSAVVSGRCACGCATVDLGAGTGPRALTSPVQDGVLISADVRGRSDGVLLFVEEGHLSCLEVYSIKDEPATLPQPEDLIVDAPRSWE
ncbi:hypothetical protein IMZ11_28585 [Microtetraspora sp. AC03309]|uniref:hypothetical protein n=1 Tax=Microtetraspora sp. AC03309 TaxID=2779376 RepID=UPI001E3BF134|nr:hypothetical protein [Microtetraspora sp. AC03309]MCC5579593.1 hypothetical protein [Microtetraspora sp. AC03309]